MRTTPFPLCSARTHRHSVRALGAFLIAVAAACGTTSVTTDRDQRADFGRYRTYAIQPGRVQMEGVEASPDTLVRDRIQDALKLELWSKGFEPARPGQADIVVTYAASSETRPELVETIASSPDWMYGGYNIFVQDVDRGTLVIDVIDARSSRLVWRSIARAEDENFRSEKFLGEAVDKALQKLPLAGAS